MRIARQLAAVVLLPGTVCVLMPALLLSDAGIAPWPLALLGGALLALGLGVIGVDRLAVRARRPRHARAVGSDVDGSSSAAPTATSATR